MAYTNNIPTASQRLKDSQPLIQNNFMEIGAALAVNHGAFNTPNVGKHLFLQMPIQSSSPTTSATEMALFTRTGITTQTEMAIRRQSDGTVSEFTGSLQATDGWTRLPSGILLKWGTVPIATVPQTLVFPVAATIPPFTALYNIQYTVGTLNVNSRGTITSFTSITFYTNVLQGNLTDLVAIYFAIGR